MSQSESLSQSGSEERLHGPDPWTPEESLLEGLCQRLCEIGLVVMVIMIAAEVIARALFHFSFEVTDEIGGYVLVAISFLSLPVSQVHHGFHHVEFVQARLSPIGRAISRLIFDLLCLLCAAILVWQLGRLELTTWLSEDVAPTILATPLWIPRLSMPLGAAVLFSTLTRTLAGDVRRIAMVWRTAGTARVYGPGNTNHLCLRGVPSLACRRYGGAVRDCGAGAPLPAPAGRGGCPQGIGPDQLGQHG